jgi:putative two-component system response regulator
VDDSPENLLVLCEILQPELRVRVANSGARALAVAQTPPYPDLILLDVMMPQLDGYAVLERLRADPRTKAIPVIFVTALDGAEDEERGLALGAVDYIAKPLRAAIVRARVRTHLLLKHTRDALAVRNVVLEAEVARRVRECQIVQDLSIRALASLAETRDKETGHHIQRTQAYVELLARGLASHPRFRAALGPDELQVIVKAAPLHDIGKVGIPDRILHKEGPLTAEEFAIMQTHSLIGSDALEKAMRSALSDDERPSLRADGGSCDSAWIAALDDVLPGLAGGPLSKPEPVDFLQVAQQIARSHHERWDGSGYPDGLAGDAIPIPARLMAVADVFDALVCRRVYKPAFDMDESIAEIEARRGSHFDPDVVDAFLAARDVFCAIAIRYAEDERTRQAFVGVHREQEWE